MKRMKLIPVILVFLFSGAMLFAADTASEPVWWGSYYMPGNLVVNGHIGYESGPGAVSGEKTYGLSVYPGAELILFKPRIIDVAPVDIGLELRGHFGLGFGSVQGGNIALGVGLMGTMHFAFRGLDIPMTEYLEKLDIFTKVGIAYDFLKYDSGPAFGLASFSGINYFLSDSLSLSAAYTHWEGLDGIALGVNLKIGPKPEVKSMNYSLDLEPLYYQAYLMQFYTVYYYSFFAGGFFIDDSGYNEGEGTIWKIVSGDDDELIIERALLKINSDGSKWWKVKFSSGDDSIVYEFLMNNDYGLLELRFKDVDSGEIREHTVKPEDTEQYESGSVNVVTRDDYAEQIKETGTVKVDAGSFKADHIVHSADQYNYEWWLSADVPGSMVKFQWDDSDTDKTAGELVKITADNYTELGSY